MFSLLEGIRRYESALGYLYPLVGNFRIPIYNNPVSGVFGSVLKITVFSQKKKEHNHNEIKVTS